MRKWPWLMAAAFSGAGTMILELAAPRLFQPWFGASIVVWTNVIGVVLLALAGGYMAGGRLADSIGVERRILRLLVIAAACATVVPFAAAPLGELLLPDPKALESVSEGRNRLAAMSLVASLLLLAPSAFFLGMVSPHFVRALTDRGIPVGAASGSVFMAETLGSLAGTALPAYLLIPLIGSRWTILTASAFMATAALVVCVLARGGGRRVAAAAVVVLAAAAAGLGVHHMPLRAALPGESLVSESESEYQYIRVARATAEGPDLKDVRETLLRINEGVREYHSVIVDDRPGSGGKYYDTVALVPALIDDDRALDVLILGSGAGTQGRLFCEYWPARMRRIVNVDVDPAVVALESAFWPERARHGEQVALMSVVADARRFLAACRDPFDIIVLDAYARQIDIPFHVATVEFFELLSSRLRPGGIVASNVSVKSDRHHLIQALAKTMETAGLGPLYLVPVEGFGNTILLARKDGAVDPTRFAGVARLERSARFAAARTRAIAVDRRALVLRDDFAPVEYLDGVFE